MNWSSRRTPHKILSFIINGDLAIYELVAKSPTSAILANAISHPIRVRSVKFLREVVAIEVAGVVVGMLN